jgi:hypothetical protein
MSTKKKSHPSIHRLRLEIAKESFRMMQSDTKEAARDSATVDISPMIELMKQAVMQHGIRNVHEELLILEPFSSALLEAAKDLQIKGFRTEILRPVGSQPTIQYHKVPNNRNFTGTCHGHLWWLYHFMGSVVSDLLLQDGRVLLVRDRTESDGVYVTTPFEYLQELRRMQRSDYPDPSHFHAQHGFVWHHLKKTQTKIDTYPVDKLFEFCQELVWKDEFVPDQFNDIARECRHSFGHALYFFIVSEEHPEYNLTLTNTLRVATKVTLSTEAYCKLERLCLSAPNKRSFHECYGGFHHRYAMT